MSFVDGWQRRLGHKEYEDLVGKDAFPLVADELHDRERKFVEQAFVQRNSRLLGYNFERMNEFVWKHPRQDRIEFSGRNKRPIRAYRIADEVRHRDPINIATWKIK